MACTRRAPFSPASFAVLVALALVGGCSDDGAAAGASEDDSSGGGTMGTGGGDVSGTQGTTSTATMSASADDGSSGAVDGTADDTGADSSGGDTGEMMGVACLDDQFVNGPSPVGNYAGFDVTIGSHCQGTNQQDITDIERIVFLGDSVTVGTPPTPVEAYYRTILARALATKFGLEPPEAQWEQVDVGNGTTILQESGAFASCAVWGARNDDLASQLESCFAVEDYPARTLVVFTLGGNDGAAIAKDYLDGVPLADVLAGLDAMLAEHEAGVQWLVEDGKFPNGVFVVNTNVYEFTDATFDFLSCPTAALAGFDSSADMPDILHGSLQHINEEYMRIAEENGTDLVFMSESFCGHGFHANDSASPCYRGPDNATWFDLTCIHPTAAGHAVLAEMFTNVISE